MAPRNARELIGAVRTRSLPRLKLLRNRLVADRAQPRLAVFVAGVHRSGTNMIMEILERSWETDVFHESDPRAFVEHMQRDEATIHALVDGSPARVVIVKALHEANNLCHLLQEFAPANAIWMYRSYGDMINSSLRRWPRWRNKIDELVKDRTSGDWRGWGMTDETHAILRQHYRPDMSDASATALFWFYRNQLLFDQGLDRDPRLHIICYERLVGDTGDYAKRLTNSLGIQLTAAMRRVAHSESVRKHASPELDAGVRELCERMHLALEAAHLRRA